jgi:hypothetical protein
MADVVAYVDGFNLYYGLAAKYGRKYLWLDLVELCRRLRAPDNVLCVRYFTSIVRGEPDAARRQETYLAALAAHRPEIEISRGYFQKKQLKCRDCGSRWACTGCVPPRKFVKYEEKLTDVAIASAMVADAARCVGEVSLLISTDTDLHPAIATCLRIAPHRPLYIACPPGRGPSAKPQLAGAVTSFLIDEANLQASLLPDSVRVPGKGVVHRPEKWCG